MVKKGARYWTKKCDQVFSKIIKAPGRCKRCGSTQDLEAAHIITKGHHQIRHDPTNALCLCKSCHTGWAHHNVKAFKEWARDLIGAVAMDLLEFKSRTIAPIDWEARYQELKELYEKVKDKYEA